MTAMEMEYSESQDRWVCYACVEDAYLSGEILGMNQVSQCDFCETTREAIEMESLADRIHDVIQNQFEPTPLYPVEWYEHWDAKEGNWEQRGEPAEVFIAETTGVSKSIASNIANLLSDRYRYRAVKEGGVDPYGYDTLYEEREPSAAPFYVSWTEFQKEILTRARFFPKTAVARLAGIFGDLNELKTVDGRPVIREVAPGDPEGVFWRARRARTDEELENILKNPARELGPPPPGLAKGLRMNATGIPVFYGARCVTTCLSEIRPPVGSKVVVGKFELLRPIRVLDLGALEEVLVGKSHFDPDYVVSRGRAAFLKQLVTEISRPVMPEDEELEYIPTQFVAEFLAHRSEPQLGGIFYPSTQTGGEGENVALFNHDCGVEPYQLPEGTEVEVYSPSIYQENDWELGERNYAVYEYVPDEHIEDSDSPTGNGSDDSESLPTEEEHFGGSFPGTHDRDDASISDGDPALRLDIDSIKVMQVKDARLNTNDFDVTRHRLPKSSRETFFQTLSGSDLDSILGDTDSPF